MIVCPNCFSHYNAVSGLCLQCGFHPQRISGFEAWSPELAHDSAGFSSDFFEDLAPREEGHFWFRSRNKLIIWALKRYFPKLASFLEVGCGTGFVLSGVAESFPTARLVGSEIFISGLEFAASRLPQAKLVQMDARCIPYVNEFDVVAAFDVLEHIKEDAEVIRGLYAALKPGGGLFLTVPQHSWLWSRVDEYACHERRYSRDDLLEKVSASGFRVIRSTSFVSLLLPAMLLSRRQKQQSMDSESLDEFCIHPVVNSILENILGLELMLIRMGWNLPIGGSRLIVAVKE
jgi:SAM-dependent methyltransferase